MLPGAFGESAYCNGIALAGGARASPHQAAALIAARAKWYSGFSSDHYQTKDRCLVETSRGTWLELARHQTVNLARSGALGVRISQFPPVVVGNSYAGLVESW